MQWSGTETQQLQPPPSACEAVGGSVSSNGRAGIPGGTPEERNIRRCARLMPPIPSKFWGDANAVMDAPMPEFHCLVNYPDYLPKNRPQVAVASSVAGDAEQHAAPPPPSCPPGTRRCVMCGDLRPCGGSTNSGAVSSPSGRARGGSDTMVGSPSRSSEGGDNASAESSPRPDEQISSSCTSSSAHIIPRQNKGLCTSCDVSVWVMTNGSGLEIKWCKGCKNFRKWVDFGIKGFSSKCQRCRAQQAERYALQKKEEKDNVLVALAAAAAAGTTAGAVVTKKG